MLVDCMARSLAHTVGNAISVISGRLSLVEADESLTEHSRGAVHRAQERLKRLHTDLRGVLKFSAPPDDHCEARLSDTLALLRDGGMITSQEWEEFANCPTAADGTVAAASMPLLRLNTAYRQIAAEPTLWGLSRTQQRQSWAITLRILFQTRELPPDRRALTEPWFSREAQTLPSAARYGRLLLAESLALLEDAQVAVSIDAGASPSESWWLVLAWPLSAAV
jgi:hypothetical protein